MLPKRKIEFKVVVDLRTSLEPREWHCLSLGYTEEEAIKNQIDWIEKNYGEGEFDVVPNSVFDRTGDTCYAHLRRKLKSLESLSDTQIDHLLMDDMVKYWGRAVPEWYPCTIEAESMYGV